ncbi:MAG: NLP/P60 protein [Berkelbacteria bacterium GW2011_GWA1_39_10]|uniref:NLP/P60 protein n=1 Tax=Berkelbacteria bacterium GW2011_GWA1_39_10 TaxID=1618332 RepID=A0A0G0NYE5_9BACT|nr:MAG: NLP/P60 protein [Berkelbacteria bacterium GW2011_GWA1_39_10]
MFTLIRSTYIRLTYGLTLNKFWNTSEYFKNLIQDNYQKISAVSMAIKLIMVLVILALTPMDTIKAKRETYKTAVKLDTTNPFVLRSDNRQVAIAVGQANVDKNSKKATGQIAYAGRIETVSGVENFIGLYKDAASRYGIPWQVLAAVHYVETGASGSTDRSSYAGAQGPMQFMPGTWRAYGVDGNNDGVTDANDVNDAVYGAANLLAASGAAEGNVDGALFNYNHSQSYVNKVKEVASSIQ